MVKICSYSLIINSFFIFGKQTLISSLKCYSCFYFDFQYSIENIYKTKKDLPQLLPSFEVLARGGFGVIAGEVFMQRNLFHSKILIKLL